MGRHERKGESDGICSDTQTQTEIAAGPPIVWQAQRWGRQGLAEQVLGINHRPVRGEHCPPFFSKTVWEIVCGPNAVNGVT